MATQPMAVLEDKPRQQSRLKSLSLGLAAALLAANGAWMLTDPVSWFAAAPGAADSGPLNVHFVRDVGLAFLGAAAAAVLAARRPRLAYPLMAVASIFVCGHGLLHVAEGWPGLGNHRIQGEEAMTTIGLAALFAGLTLWVRPRQGAR